MVRTNPTGPTSAHLLQHIFTLKGAVLKGKHLLLKALHPHPSAAHTHLQRCSGEATHWLPLLPKQAHPIIFLHGTCTHEQSVYALSKTADYHIQILCSHSMTTTNKIKIK
jgi:hypothetical protein